MIGGLERLTLAERIGRDLIAAIRTDGLQPGDELPPEAEIAASFGVSRPVVREALAQLRSLGMVAVRSGRPATVREVDSSLPRAFFHNSIALRDTDATELFEVRGCLEVQSAALAARRADAADLARIRGCLEPMAQAIRSGCYDTFVEIDLTLHLAIAQASGNLMLLHLIEGIREPVRDSIRLGLASRETPQELSGIVDVHASIIDAIASREPALAAAAMSAHFDVALSAICGAQR